MELARQRELFQRLCTELADVVAEPGVGEAEGQSVLHFLLPLHEDGSGLVYYELLLGDYRQEYTLLTVVVTVLPKLGTRGEALQTLLTSWNRRTLLGAYGLYPEQDALGFHYTLPLERDADADAVAAAVTRVLYLTWDELGDKYDALCAVADGRVTIEQARERGWL